MATPPGWFEITIVEHSREPNLRMPPPAMGKRLLNVDQIVTVQAETRPQAQGKTVIWLINDSVLVVMEPYSYFRGILTDADARGPAAASISNVGVQSVPIDVMTNLVFNGAPITSNSGIIAAQVPQGLKAVIAGTYELNLYATFSPSNYGVRRDIRLFKNGADLGYNVPAGPMHGTLSATGQTIATVPLAAGDVIGGAVYQDSNKALDVTTTLSMTLEA